jgi:hypothetical protein
MGAICCSKTFNFCQTAQGVLFTITAVRTSNATHTPTLVRFPWAAPNVYCSLLGFSHVISLWPTTLLANTSITVAIFLENVMDSIWVILQWTVRCTRSDNKVRELAAVDRNLSMVWWRWHISVSQLCCCWSMAMSLWETTIIVWVCFASRQCTCSHGSVCERVFS